MSEVDLAKSWEEFCDLLRDAGRQVLDASPDDDFDRAEGLRYVTRLAANFLKANLEEADPARAVLNQSGVKIGLDNPTTPTGEPVCRPDSNTGCAAASTMPTPSAWGRSAEAWGLPKG